MAIEHGLSIIGWFENNTQSDIPPEHLWDDAEGLDKWWQRVAARREESMSGGEYVPEDDMASNDLADLFKQ